MTRIDLDQPDLSDLSDLSDSLRPSASSAVKSSLLSHHARNRHAAGYLVHLGLFEFLRFLYGLRHGCHDQVFENFNILEKVIGDTTLITMEILEISVFTKKNLAKMRSRDP